MATPSLTLAETQTEVYHHETASYTPSAPPLRRFDSGRLVLLAGDICHLSHLSTWPTNPAHGSQSSMYHMRAWSRAVVPTLLNLAPMWAAVVCRRGDDGELCVSSK